METYNLTIFFANILRQEDSESTLTFRTLSFLPHSSLLSLNLTVIKTPNITTENPLRPKHNEAKSKCLYPASDIPPNMKCILIFIPHSFLLKLIPLEIVQNIGFEADGRI